MTNDNKNVEPDPVVDYDDREPHKLDEVLDEAMPLIGVPSKIIVTNELGEDVSRHGGYETFEEAREDAAALSLRLRQPFFAAWDPGEEPRVVLRGVGSVVLWFSPGGLHKVAVLTEKGWQISGVPGWFTGADVFEMTRNTSGITDIREAD